MKQMTKEKFREIRRNFRILDGCECEGEYHPAIAKPIFDGFERFTRPRVWRNYHYMGKNLIEAWKNSKRFSNPREHLRNEMRNQYVFH